jgi:hypothetical protein
VENNGMATGAVREAGSAAILGLVGLLLAAGPSTATEPLGAAPTYTDRMLTPPTNAAAITRRIWAPGLDVGYVAQGLAIADGALFVSSYLSTDPARSKGPCRLFRIEPAAGRVTGALDLPADCGHAGGLARGAPGRIWVADTFHLFEVEIAAPPKPGLGGIVRSVRLAGDVRGSFAAGAPDAIWLGRYSKDAGARLWRFELSRLKPIIDERDATMSLPVPSEAQGAAFDASGALWLTRSGSRFGELLRLDPRTGEVLARHAMPAGVEDISFAPDGGLWAVSEAGSRRWLGWPTFYPLIFRLDPTRLR